MSEIIRIPFHDTEVLALEIDGKAHVILRPALERLGVDFDSQRKKLDGKSWARKVLITAQLPGSPQRREVLAVDVRTFLMLLATIDEKRVGVEVRPLLIAYQCEVADVVERHFLRLRGHAEDPAAFTWTLDETCAILRQRCHLHHSPISLGKLLRTAGVWKQNGAPTVAFAELFHFTGSAWTVLPIGMPKIAKRLLKVTYQLQQSYAIQMRLQLEGVGGDIQLTGETGPEMLQFGTDGVILPPAEAA